MSSIIAANERGLTQAAAILRHQGLVAFPTETVYGLGGDATSTKAVAAIFAAKNRPRFNPLIIHVPTLEEALTLGRFSKDAQALAQLFWPGPLTLVVPKAETSPITELASAGNTSIALRVPAHPIAQALLLKAQIPLAAPSANPSGKLSPTRAEHVRDSLKNNVDLILDGGPTRLGLESTIIACFDDNNLLLRQGAISQEEIKKVLHSRLKSKQVQTKQPTSSLLSPGQQKSHYAPNAKLRMNATKIKHGEHLLAFGETDLPHSFNLSRAGNLQEAASNLFAMLHALDNSTDKIAVMPIPKTGLGCAINDRLSRASAAR